MKNKMKCRVIYSPSVRTIERKVNRFLAKMDVKKYDTTNIALNDSNQCCVMITWEENGK